MQTLPWCAKRTKRITHPKLVYCKSMRQVCVVHKMSSYNHQYHQKRQRTVLQEDELTSDPYFYDQLFEAVPSTLTNVSQEYPEIIQEVDYRPPPVQDAKRKAKELLLKYWGLKLFRGSQEEIVSHVTNGQSALVLMPTGGGVVQLQLL